jgi:hypothetical protein
MKMTGIFKIIVSVSGVLGLIAILYIYGSTMISAGATTSNDALASSGWGIIAFGTIVLFMIVFIPLILKKRS